MHFYCTHPIVLALSILIPLSSTMAQKEKTLFVGLTKSKGYVVGAKLSQSGLHSYAQDTSWNHIGWNHPHLSGVAIDPTNTNYMYMAGGNGAFQSKNGGKSWKITTGWEVTEAQAICVDQGAPENVYVASAYGVWRSSDHADTWVEFNDGLTKKYTQIVASDKSRAGRILAGTEGGIFASTHNGKWQSIGAPGKDVLDLDQSAENPNIWIAGTRENGIFLSSDNGTSWQQGTGKMSKASIYCVAIDPFDVNHMAAAGWDTWVYVTKDGGKSWKQYNKGLPVDDVYNITFDANVPGRLWVATVEEGIFTTSDAGKNWVFKGMYGSLVFDMVFLQSGNY